MRKLTTLLALTLLCAVPVGAQSLSGTVSGVVKDESGGALPGATITITGKAGSKTTTTDAQGEYRFPALDPGVYSITVQMQGFTARRRDDVQVSIARQAPVDFTLAVGAMTDNVEVVAEVPVVDKTSSATESALSQEMLFNLPIRPNNAATDLLNYLPGINSGSAYGGNEDYGNGLLLDGVDTRDPEGGSAWTFFNFNIVEEVQVSGLGAPAEYGAFTGAVVNTITKSGGNNFSGLFDAYYTKDSLQSDNTTTAIKTANPALADPATTRKRLDVTAQLGGPLVKEKLFFFASAQRFFLDQDPTGPRTIRKEVSPRLNLKLNYQPDSNNSFQAVFQADDYNVIGRPGVPEFQASDELTNREDAPELVWGVQWRHVFGPSTFVEAKYNGWSGYFDLNPEVEKPTHLDGTTGGYSDSQGWFYYADRGRHQVNVALSHYADFYGKHDFKFGVEVERSKVRNRYGFVNDIYYYDYTAAYPRGEYLAYDYGYDVDGRNQRESFFAQDSWKVNERLTINPGVRFDWVRGRGPALGNAKVYDTKNVAPRLGFAFDLTGDAKTVLKGHYGQYYEGIFFDAYAAALPGVEDFVTYFFDPTGDKAGPQGKRFTEIGRSPRPLAVVDSDLKHPRVDEFMAGFERALTRDLRLSVTGVLREDKNAQATVYPSAIWAAKTITNPLTNQPLTVFDWVNRSASEGNLLITNPDGFRYLGANGQTLATARTERKYRALMVVLDKRFSNRWQGRISYVASKSDGYLNNTTTNTYGQSTFFESPSAGTINTFGLLGNDRKNELKVYATYQVPRVELGLNVSFRSISGRPYAPFRRFPTSSVSFPRATGREVFLEPRGGRRNQTENILDLRLEKIFRIGDKDRVAVFADVENVFNESTVLTRITRYPSLAIGGVGNVDFNSPSTLVSPRRVTVGSRWSF